MLPKPGSLSHVPGLSYAKEQEVAFMYQLWVVDFFTTGSVAYPMPNSMWPYPIVLNITQASRFLAI